MKKQIPGKLRGPLFIAALLSLIPTIFYAGEYHAPKEKTYLGATETLVCSQCHTMHGDPGRPVHDIRRRKYDL